jgi:hypothetical protein
MVYFPGDREADRHLLFGDASRYYASASSALLLARLNFEGGFIGMPCFGATQLRFICTIEWMNTRIGPVLEQVSRAVKLKH